MARTMSFTSSSVKLGSMITPPMRPRMSIVRGQDSAPYRIALPWGVLNDGQSGWMVALFAIR